MAALFYGAGKGREGSRRIVLTIWSATGSEQQPPGLFKDAISIDGIFKRDTNPQSSYFIPNS